MKITDISIKSTNLQITGLSEQEAHEVVGGFSSSILKFIKKQQKIAIYDAGVPGLGGEYDHSCSF